MDTYFITTQRLILKPFTLSDIAKVYKMSLEIGIRDWIPDQVYRSENHTK